MTATATVLGYPAGDKVAAKAALESLGVTGSEVVTWQQDNYVYIAKVIIT